MKRLILTIYFWLMFFTVTSFGLLILPLFLLVYIGFLRRTVDFSVRWAICIYGWILVKVVPFLAPVKVEYRNKGFPLPAIFVPNHNSAIDPYLFGSLLTDVCFVTTWAFKIPVYSYFMRLANYIDATEGWENVYQKGAAVLRSGASLIIWPEGHRSRDGRLGRFKNGAFALSVKTGYPLLPVCILGSGEFLPPGKRLITPSLVKMVLLDPIYPNLQNDPEREIIRLRNTVEAVIKRTIQDEKDSSHLARKMKKPLLQPLSKAVERGEKC